jgi:hypothetical protein
MLGGYFLVSLVAKLGTCKYFNEKFIDQIQCKTTKLIRKEGMPNICIKLTSRSTFRSSFLKAYPPYIIFS